MWDYTGGLVPKETYTNSHPWGGGRRICTDNKVNWSPSQCFEPAKVVKPVKPAYKHSRPDGRFRFTVSTFNCPQLRHLPIFMQNALSATTLSIYPRLAYPVAWLTAYINSGNFPLEISQLPTVAADWVSRLCRVCWTSDADGGAHYKTQFADAVHQLIAPSSRHSDADSAGCDTVVYPLVQMGPVDVTVDETVTGRVFRGAPSRAVLYLASGYFNLTDNYQRCVVDECAATFSILSAAPEVLSDSHAHTRLTALCLRLPGWACTREVKPIWILLKE